MKTIKKQLLILVIAAVMVAPAGCKRSEDVKALQNKPVERSTTFSKKPVRKPVS